MPTEVPAGYFQVAYHLNGPGQSGQLEIVAGHIVNGAPLDDAIAARDTFQDFFVEQMLAVPITFVGLQARFGPQPGGVVVDLAPDNTKPTVGTQGANILPLNNAMLVKKNTGLGGRKNQGRMYVPGIDEDIVGNDGVLLSTAITQYSASAFAWLQELDTQGVGLYILHSDPLDVPTQVLNLLVQPKMATQRARLRD